MVAVTFYVADGSLPELLGDSDPNTHPEQFGYGVCVWIVQTYIFLKNAHDVYLSPVPPREGIVVLHANDIPKFVADVENTDDILLCAVRADKHKSETKVADMEIVQNRASARGARRRFIPHWPQPGLIPRNPDRTEFSNLAFKGHSQEKNHLLNSAGWHEFLDDEGLAWVDDSPEFQGRAYRVYSEGKWYDYADIDAVVALRTDLRRRYRSKPASKLINCWHAGVPAILGPEAAYRELRQSEFDYFEVSTFDQLTEAVRLLKNNPAIREAMRQNGFKRAREYAVSSIRAEWLAFIDEAQVQLSRKKRQRSFWRKIMPVGVQR